MRLEWEQRQTAPVGSLDELDALVDRLEADVTEKGPFVVLLVGEDGTTLSMGLGSERSVLTFTSGSLEPPYFQSVGDESGGEPLEFRFQREISEFPPHAGVPRARAGHALREFFQTRQLPSAVRWEET